MTAEAENIPSRTKALYLWAWIDLLTAGDVTDVNLSMKRAKNSRPVNLG